MTTFDQALASRGLRYGEFLNLKNFNASGLDLSTTGSTTSGGNSWTLASAVDLAAGQGIVVHGARAVATAQQPTRASATPGGTTGATTYNYRAPSVDSNGGVGAAIAHFTTTTGK